MINKDAVIETLKTIKDPEIDLDIWTMGMVYDIVTTDESVKIVMTYTTPFCPWGPQLQEEVRTALEKLGFKKIEIEITFEPPYKMPEELRAMMGM